MKKRELPVVFIPKGAPDFTTEAFKNPSVIFPEIGIKKLLVNCPDRRFTIEELCVEFSNTLNTKKSIVTIIGKLINRSIDGGIIKSEYDGHKKVIFFEKNSLVNE